MSTRRFFAELAAMDVLEAREALRDLVVVTNPQLTKGQHKLWEKLKAAAQGPVDLEAEYVRGRAFLVAKSQMRQASK